MACSGHLLCRLKHKNKNDAAARRLLRSAATALLVAPGLASADGFDRGFVETDELRLIYYRPYESYLVPHATQSFLSALDAHRRLWDYVPDGRVNVFLRDPTDIGNAGSYEAPWNEIEFEIAPSYSPFETFSSGDRFAVTAVHELTHIATKDRAAPVDARFRRLFSGKVEVEAAHPES